MKKRSKHVKQNRLIEQLKRRLFLSAGLFLLVLMVLGSLSLLTTSAQYKLSEQKVAIRVNLDGMLNSMIDQETGLRGYITTNDPRFLGPFNSGRPQYLASVRNLKNLMQSKVFSEATPALTQADAQAEDWYSHFALVQIKNMQTGNFATARSDNTAATGKALFDRFRAAEANLEQVVGRILVDLQTREDTFNWAVLAGAFFLSVIAIALAWRALTRFSSALVEQLQTLKDTSSRLGSGDWSVRVPDLAYVELNQFGRTFNLMADALQQQQEKGLKERGVLESVLQLNTLLTYSLDKLELKAIIDGFLNKALTLLDLHIGALYLYDSDRKQLTLFAAQGLDLDQAQPQFRAGEGTVGRVVVSREPLYLTRPTGDEAKGFVVKSMLGVIPTSSGYYLPLVRGNELLGVLAVASIFPMTEKVRNVLNVVASNLSSTISNTRAYQHIQEQAEELEKRGHEQERTNAELRRQRDELTTLNAALEEANRARSRFLSTMSHELRTPLASIIGFSQLLLDNAEQANYTQRQKSNLERILKNAKHLLVLINDVLDLAKIEAGRMDVNYSQVDLRELISSVVEETQSIAIEQKLVLGYSVEEGIDYLETNPMKLHQILLNLVSNALKFTEKGEVTITARRITSSGTDADHVALAVKDTGMGIPADIQERIFEAFYQVDGSYTRKSGGTGLGLSIVKQLTTLLGGTIEVTSAPGHGSTFTVILPIKAAHQPVEQNSLRLHPAQQAEVPTLPLSSDELMPAMLRESLTASANPEATDGQNKVVLAVDDNPDVIVLIKAALENTSYTVVGVSDPLQVMELVQQMHPCAITLDVMMPGLNGWQLLHQLKANPATVSIPVIMLTVLSEPATGYVLGADDYLIKPFKKDALFSTLDHLVASRRSSSQASKRETQETIQMNQ